MEEGGRRGWESLQALSEGEREGLSQRILNAMPLFLRKVWQGHGAVLQPNLSVREPWLLEMRLPLSNGAGLTHRLEAAQGTLYLQCPSGGPGSLRFLVVREACSHGGKYYSMQILGKPHVIAQERQRGTKK